jgi:hypothetical protein
LLKGATELKFRSYTDGTEGSLGIIIRNKTNETSMVNDWRGIDVGPNVARKVVHLATGMLPRLLLVAVRDISAGAEILQDYSNAALLHPEIDMFESIEGGAGNRRPGGGGRGTFCSTLLHPDWRCTRVVEDTVPR